MKQPTALILTALFALIPTQSAEQITDTAAKEVWSTNHIVHVDGKLIYIEEGATADDEKIMYFDGTSSSLVQSGNAGIPSLDLVAQFVFGLGTGATSSEVVGAWRRGADYAWVWTSGQSPVQIDTFAANVMDPTKPTNPEAVAIADGCVFMVMQANDGGVTVNRVFKIDTTTGQPQLVSTAASEFGASRVASSQCRAAWVHDPNTDATGNTLPLELQYYDGSQTTVLDRGVLRMREFDLEGDTLVYIKEVQGASQVLHKDLSSPSTPSTVISSTDLFKRFPATDGHHIAWGERHVTPEGNSLHIVLHGDIELSDMLRTRAESSIHSFVLDSGQISARQEFAQNGEAIWHWGNNRWNHVNRAPVEPEFSAAQLSLGRVAFFSPPDAGEENDIFLSDEIQPVPFSVIPPPMAVRADFGVRRARVRFNRVIGADRYNIYYAEDPSVTPQNYASLPSGAMLSTENNEVIVENLPLGVHHHFVVTSVSGSHESPASSTASTRGFLVDSTTDAPDANSSDGVCATAAGDCTLRAAIMEASDDPDGFTVAVPNGTYVLNIPVSGSNEGATGDLDIEHGPITVVGENRDATIIDANGMDHAFQLLNGVFRGSVEIRGLTVQNAAQTGIVAGNGILKVHDSRIVDNGPFDRGGGFSQDSEFLLVADSVIEGNQAGSHGAAIMVNGRDSAVELYRSRVVNNTATLGGGAIYAQSEEHISIHDSVVDGNSSPTAGWGGGAIVSERSADIFISRSQVSNHFGNGCGGAILMYDGDLFVHNSTFTNNQSFDEGGAICAWGSSSRAPRVSVFNSTLVGNSCSSCDASNGATLGFAQQADFDVSHSILEVDAGLSNCASGIAMTSHGYNIDSGDSCQFAATDYVNTDPQLSTLGDYGGATMVHVPQVGSVALDGGALDACHDAGGAVASVDQRGAPRPYDYDGDSAQRCDIGAVEDLGPCVDADSDGFNGDAGDLRCRLSAFGGGDCDDTNSDVYPLAPQVCDGLNNDCSDLNWPDPLGTNDGDADGDGFSTCAGDCLDTDPDSYAVPGEVINVTFTDTVTLDWDAPIDPGGATSSLLYDVHRSDSALDLSLGAICLRDSLPGNSVSDATTPPAGAAHHYLVRAANACPEGPGSWGAASDSTTREANACP